MDSVKSEDYILHEEPIDFSKYLNVVFRKRWILLSVMAIVMTITLVKTFTEIPKYRATTLIMIDSPSSTAPVTTQEGIRSSLGEGYFATQQNILTSIMLARRVKVALNLPFSEYDLIGMININAIKNSRLVKISVDYKDPAIAAKIANTLVDRYIEQNVEAMLFMSKEVLRALPDEERGKIEKSTIYGQLSELGKEETIDSLPSIAYNPVIQRLRGEKISLETELADLSKRYREKHPKIIALKTKINFIEGSLRFEKDKTLNTIKADLAGRLQVNNIRVIDPADIPKKPISPNKPRDIISGLLLSVFLGIGTIFFIESMDDSIKNKTDIEEHIKLPYLGEFPVLRNYNASTLKASKFDELEKNHEAAEAIRHIRTNIIFSAPKDTLKTILLTSTIPQEGKSFIASYLAFSFAKNGIKTLLIDADIRKPVLNKFFEIDRSPGLTNLLVEDMPAEAVIRPTPYANLYIMPCGAESPNPLELLDSEKMTRVIKKLSEKFGKIIIDSPPSLALSDALVLSKLSDGVIFIAKSGFISREVLGKLKDRFLVTNSAVLGIIMNFFEMKEHSYYKDKYYHKYYKNYYHTNK